jgi:tripartite-type tricarboxylate transporter receptor subunit TctC
VRNARELIALAKARPKQMNMGNAGSPLSTYNLNMLAKVNIEPIPFKGAGPLMTDLMGGHIPLAIAAISSVQSAVKSGRARIIGVGTLTPSVFFPEAPVIADDVPGFESVSWFGLMAPRGTARELVQRIRNDVAAVLQQPEIRQRLLDIGGEPVGNTPEEFEARIRKEIAMWRQVAEVANIKPQ